MGLPRGGIEADVVIIRANINGAIANGPGIGGSTSSKGVDDNSVVASTSVDGRVVVDANGIGITPAIPPPAAVAVGIGIDIDDVVARTRLDAGVAGTGGIAPAAVPPPAAIAVGGSVDIDACA